MYMGVIPIDGVKTTINDRAPHVYGGDPLYGGHFS